MKTSLKFTAYSRRAKYVLYPTAAFALVTFFAFVIGSIHFGGDALNGYVRAGHYFLCAHGSCAEVSSAIWHYSYWHAWASIGGILLVLAETALFLNTGDIHWR
ncbi:MAG TPA: hypothetical protein VIX87_02830 [Steroidobacteraceae bacterium]